MPLWHSPDASPRPRMGGQQGIDPSRSHAAMLLEKGDERGASPANAFRASARKRGLRRKSNHPYGGVIAAGDHLGGRFRDVEQEDFYPAGRLLPQD